MFPLGTLVFYWWRNQKDVNVAFLNISEDTPSMQQLKEVTWLIHWLHRSMIQAGDDSLTKLRFLLMVEDLINYQLIYRTFIDLWPISDEPSCPALSGVEQRDDYWRAESKMMLETKLSQKLAGQPSGGETDNWQVSSHAIREREGVRDFLVRSIIIRQTGSIERLLSGWGRSSILGLFSSPKPEKKMVNLCSLHPKDLSVYFCWGLWGNASGFHRSLGSAWSYSVVFYYHGCSSVTDRADRFMRDIGKQILCLPPVLNVFCGLFPLTSVSVSVGRGGLQRLRGFLQGYASVHGPVMPQILFYLAEQI